MEANQTVKMDENEMLEAVQYIGMVYDITKTLSEAREGQQ